jgi:acetyl esterase/lipase
LLFVASVIVLLSTFRRLWSRKIAAVFALGAAALSAVPYSKVAQTVRQFDRELARAFPPARNAAPAPAFGRTQPFVAKELVLGIETNDDIRIIRDVRFAAPEGLPLSLDVYRPVTEGPFPVLVQIHGGSWQRGSRSDSETFARYFAGRGFVVFSIEYRFAPRFPWPAAFDDVRAAMTWIAAQAFTFEGDAARIALVGRSAGAHLALLAAYNGDTPVRAVVNFYGPPDLEKGWRELPSPDPSEVRGLLETFLGGTPDSHPRNYREASPVGYVTGGAPPSLHIYGLRDHVVLPQFGRDLHARLRTAGARSVLLEIPWADHAFDELPSGLSGQLSLYCIERFLAAAMPRPR